ncbi:MAG: NifB/NifX family molybdenum-iron cluster-binding protein [Candidatus Bathyarchaeota archaeon]|nr:NifB/NifX family molybdenum-iron cluster-binding protein [Candidatus Bathyarchaeota archaeon]
MKICLTSTTNSPQGQLDPRFGRCPYLLIIDTETHQYEALPNMAASAGGGAGIQAAQTIANRGAKALITGNVGPNAFRALRAAGIEIYIEATGSIGEVLAKFKAGQLRKANSATVGEHSGGIRREE